MTQEGFRRRLIALVVVLALHCLFVSMLWLREPITLEVARSELSSVLFFVEAPRPAATTAPPVQSPPMQAAPTIVLEPKALEEQTSTAPTAPNPSATIDWTAQATEAAAAVVDKAIHEDPRKCDPSAAPRSFLPPCHHEAQKFDWNPDAARVGFSGGLPYVRVGDRCVVGLGFFGCGFGAAPPANGDLFEGMEDAERERSSVPSPTP